MADGMTVTMTMTIEAATAMMEVAEAGVDDYAPDFQEAVHDAIQALRKALAALGVEIDG